MKYRTFRNVLSLGLFAALGGTCYGCYACWHSSMAGEESAERARHLEDTRRAAMAEPIGPTPTVSTPAASTSASTTGTATGPRELDTALLHLVSTRPVTAKIKDAFSGKPWKVNVYADDGKRFNRAKVDLDRDEHDDESWTFNVDGSVERKVSSKDDDHYDQRFVLDGTTWRDPAAPVVAKADAATIKGTEETAPGLRAVDTTMMDLLQSVRPTAKVKDATKGKSYKINLYADDGKRFNRAKVDLDRDDAWDESWTIRSPNDVERQVSTKDNGTYDLTFALTPSGWAPKAP